MEMETKVTCQFCCKCVLISRVTPELRVGKYDTSRGGGGDCEGRVAKYLSIGHIQY